MTFVDDGGPLNSHYKRMAEYPSLFSVGSNVNHRLVPPILGFIAMQTEIKVLLQWIIRSEKQWILSPPNILQVSLILGISSQETVIQWIVLIMASKIPISDVCFAWNLISFRTIWFNSSPSRPPIYKEGRQKKARSKKERRESLVFSTENSICLQWHFNIRGW